MLKLLSLAMLLNSVICTYACASQTDFNLQQNSTVSRFEYHWLDAERQPQQLAFRLNNTQLFSLFRDFIPFEQARLDREVFMAAQKIAASADPRVIDIQVKQGFEQLEIQYQAYDQDTLALWQNRLTEALETTRSNYLQRHYYTRFSTSLLPNGIKPDHKRFIVESEPLLTPVVEAFKGLLGSQASETDIINTVINWVQSIPYNSLEEQDNARGPGFLPPNQLLFQNHGDCDSKAVLAAAVLHNLLPHYNLVMVYLPDHALLAIQKSAISDEKTLFYQGEELVFLEVAGPAVVPAGQLSDSSERAIAQGQLEIEEIQFRR